MRGNASVSALVEVPPTVISLVNRSSNVLIPDVAFHATHTLTSLLALPIQVNLVPSNCAPFTPRIGSKPVPRPIVPITPPSLGATRNIQLARRRLPAPSMFFITTVGLP